MFDTKLYLMTGNIGVIKLLLENEADILATDEVRANRAVLFLMFTLSNLF